MTSPFAAAYDDITALGYRCVPLIAPGAPHGGRGKAPGVIVGGHWQGMSRWQRFRDEGPGAFDLNLWRGLKDANIGLVLGSPAGDGYVIAVDVDTTDADALDMILGALPASPMVKRGAKGETRFYCAPKEVKTRCYDGPDGRLVDLLTGFDTRQTVVPPSIHPQTGQAYVWTRGPVAAADLPAFTADDLAKLEETLQLCGWAREGRSPLRSGPPRPAPADSDDIWSEAKQRAMADFDAWVPALEPGLYDIRRRYGGGYEGVATWRASSTGQPIEKRKRNLKIHPSGIRDMGTNDTYSALDLVQAARGCDLAEATDWLRERLGLKESAVVIALEPRARGPQTVENKGVEVGAEPAPLASIRDHYPPEPFTCINGQDTSELPEHLTRNPGLLGEITDWICDTARRPQRGLALGAAICLIGTAAGRKFAGPTVSGTHLYTLCIAPTSAGKEHPQQQAKRILTEAGMGRHLGPPQFMSMSALVSAMAREPLQLSVMDEFGAFLTRINGRKSSPHERAITGVLRTAWGSSFDSMATPEWAGRSSQTIFSPALSIFGASVPDEFYESLEGGDVFNGFLNRFLIIATRHKPADRDPPRDKFEVPEEITGPLQALFNAAGPLAAATMHNHKAEAPMIVVPWDDSMAKLTFEALGQEIEEMSEQGARAFYGRTHEMAVRLATIRALGRAGPRATVTVEDMDWGRDLAMWSAARTMQDAQMFMADNPHQAEFNRVLRIIRERGRISARDLGRALGGRLRARDLKDLLDQMNQAELVQITKTTPPAGGPATLWYSAAA